MAADLEFVASLLSAAEGSSSTEAIARSLKRNRQSTERQPRQIRNMSSPGKRRAQQQQLKECEEQGARSGLKHPMDVPYGPHARGAILDGRCRRVLPAWQSLSHSAAAQARLCAMLQALAESGETRANPHPFLSCRLQQYQEPGPQSTAAALHCQACSCWVPRQPADNWQQHVRGIRHRRQLVSLRLTGQLGNMTVSLFEALPGKATAVACSQDCTILRWQEQQASRSSPADLSRLAEPWHALEIASPFQLVLVHLAEQLWHMPVLLADALPLLWQNRLLS